MTVRTQRKKYDSRIYSIFKSKAMSQQDIAIHFDININTVYRAIKREQAKEAAIKEFGEL